MQEEQINIRRAENFLNGTLNTQERLEFEERLISDPLFKAEFEEKKLFFESLNRYYRTEKLRSKLNEIHNEVQPIAVKSKIRQLYPAIGVAASISAITILLASLVFIYIDQKPKATFRELSRDMERIKRDQQAIIKNIKKTENTIIPKPGKYEGTGFAISSNGYVVTSYHLIKGSSQLTIENQHGVSFEAKEVYSDPSFDIAVLKITDTTFTGFENLPYCISRKGAEIGEKIYTLGFPREEMVYGEGSISSQTGYEGDTSSYQVSIPVNPGNSGGPVFDDQGNLVGLISGKQANTEGAAFAIKTSYLLKTIEEIPADSVKRKIRVPKSSSSIANRVKQIKKFRDFVFIVKVN